MAEPYCLSAAVAGRKAALRTAHCDFVGTRGFSGRVLRSCGLECVAAQQATDCSTLTVGWDGRYNLREMRKAEEAYAAAMQLNFAEA